MADLPVLACVGGGADGVEDMDESIIVPTAMTTGIMAQASHRSQRDLSSRRRIREAYIPIELNWGQLLIHPEH